VRVGDAVLKSGDDGTLKLLVDDDLMKVNPAVAMDARPSGVDFAD
jgi:hypothetical protein